MSTQDFGDQVFLWLARDVRVDRIQDELLQFRRLSRLRVDVVPDDVQTDLKLTGSGSSVAVGPLLLQY